MTFRRSGSDLYVKDDASGQEIRVRNQLSSSSSYLGVERIELADGTSWNLATINANAPIQGTASSDTLAGSAASDKFIGGAGNDTMSGNGGGDTYVYASGDDSDVISDSGAATDMDVLRFTNLNVSDVTLRRLDADLFIRINLTGHEIAVTSQYAGSGIERIEFADGSIWNTATIDAHAWIRGTAANETFAGSTFDDVFFGDLGNDTLRGEVGGDVYVYRSGDGSDVIDDVAVEVASDGYTFNAYTYGGSSSEVDVLRLTDLDASDVTLRRSGNDLYVRDNATGQDVRVVDHFGTSHPWGSWTPYWGMERIEFADGSSWDRATINANAWYRGSTGNDSISGSNSNDTLFGDLGNDTLAGGNGSDVYVYRSGDGSDAIDDGDSGSSPVDVLRLIDLNAAEVALRRQNNDLYVKINATGEEIRVEDHFNSRGLGGPGADPPRDRRGDKRTADRRGSASWAYPDLVERDGCEREIAPLVQRGHSIELGS